MHAISAQKSLPLFDSTQDEKPPHHSKNSSLGLDFAKSYSRIGSKADIAQREAAAKSSRIKTIREIVKGFYKKNLDLSAIHQIQQRSSAKQTTKATPVKPSDLQTDSKRLAGQPRSLQQSSDREVRPLAQSERRLVPGKSDSNSRKDDFFSDFFSKNYPSIVQVRRRPTVQQLAQLKTKSDRQASERSLEPVPADPQPTHRRPGPALQQLDSSWTRLAAASPGTTESQPRQPSPASKPSVDALDSRQPPKSDILLRKRPQLRTGQFPSHQEEPPATATRTQPSPRARFAQLSPLLPVTRFSTDLPARLALPVSELSPKPANASGLASAHHQPRIKA